MFQKTSLGFLFHFFFSIPCYAHENKISVGFLLSQTGSLSDIGIQAEHGWRLALEDLKATPFNHLIDPIFMDTSSDPTRAATAVNELIHRKVQVILGGPTSTETLAAAPIAQAAQIPILTPSSTSDKIKNLGNFVFQACYPDRFQGKAMANYAFDVLHAKTAAILVDNDMDHSRDVSKVFEETFKSRAGQILVKATFRGSKDLSLRSQIIQIKRVKPDVLYAPIYYSTIGPLLREFKTFQIDTQILGTDAWDSPQIMQLAGSAGNGAILTNPFSSDNPEPMIQAFVKAYHKRTGKNPGSYAALAYDSTFLLAQALTEMDPSLPFLNLEIQKRLSRIQSYKGVTGMINLSSNADQDRSEITLLKMTAEGFRFLTSYQLGSP